MLLAINKFKVPYNKKTSRALQGHVTAELETEISESVMQEL